MFGGSRIATLTATTASDGWAQFSRSAHEDVKGVYTTADTATKIGAVYDAANDVKNSTTYTLRRSGGGYCAIMVLAC
jgi:hypothetical protein